MLSLGKLPWNKSLLLSVEVAKILFCRQKT